MKKRIGISVILLVFGVFVLFGNSGSAGSTDGEDLFQSKCGQCHKSGSEVPVFAPVKYASIQWERFFKRNKHKRKKDISGVVAPGEIEAIKQYLMDHAADSDRPIAAGLR